VTHVVPITIVYFRPWYNNVQCSACSQCRHSDTLQRLWSVFTGYVFKSGSSLKLLSWHIKLSTALHCPNWHHSSPVLLMFRPGAGFNWRLPTNSSFRHFICLQLEQGLYRLLAPTFGTVCFRMWPLRHHWLYLEILENVWRQYCSVAAVITRYLNFFSLTVVQAIFVIFRPVLWWWW